MNDRQIAILVDGGFFLKRLPKLVSPSRCANPHSIVACFRHMCRNHIKALTETSDQRWHKYVYRIFYYDAAPFDGVAHHPFDNRQISFGHSDLARQRIEIFDNLKKQRNVALRLGKVLKDGDWSLISPFSRKVIPTKHWIESLDLSLVPEGGGDLRLTKEQVKEALRLQKIWSGIESHQVRLPLKQKGVDMRIGLDIASLTLKKQVNTIILVAGDSDFVPAAKLARREGVQFILDPLWLKVRADLFEHIDGLQSGLPRPKSDWIGTEIDQAADSDTIP